jgi:hypothetical protein
VPIVALKSKIKKSQPAAVHAGTCAAALIPVEAVEVCELLIFGLQ